MSLLACTSSPKQDESPSPLPQESESVGVDERDDEKPTITPVEISPIRRVCNDTPTLVAGVPGSPGNKIPSDVNPNGNSELAHLMREMLAEASAARDHLAAGTPRPALALKTHGKIRCAWPTEDSMREGPFDPMAITYFQAVERYNSSPRNAQDHNQLLDACISCHAQTCEGPTSAIESARFIPTPPTPAENTAGE